MVSLFSDQVFNMTILAFMIVSLIAMLMAVYLYFAKKSELACQLLGVWVGLIFLPILLSQVKDISGGAPIDLRLLSNILTSVAFLFAAGGLIFRKARTVFSLIFLLLLGPGVILMMWTADLPGFDAGGLQILSAVFGILWLLLIAMIGYGYVKYGKKRKTPDN